MRLVVLTTVLMSGIVMAHTVASSRAIIQPLSGTAIVWQDGNSQGQNNNSQGQMPEPGTLALAAAGLLGAIAVARKTRK